MASQLQEEALLAILSSLAANVSTITETFEQIIANVTSASGSDTDSLVSTANRLAFAAVVIAIFAAVVASLQAILQYAHVSAVSQKCSEAAIHISQRYVVRKWKFRSWRWKYYYPAIHFEPEAFFNALYQSEKMGIRESAFFDKLEESDTFHSDWDVVVYDGQADEAQVFTEPGFHLSDGVCILIKKARPMSSDSKAWALDQEDSPKMPYRVSSGFGKTPKTWAAHRIWLMRATSLWSTMLRRYSPIIPTSEEARCGTVDDLTQEQRALWYEWLKKTRPLSSQRPRATWAQLLRAFGLLDVSGLIKAELLDADCAPSSLDVTLQRVRLGYMGYLALVLGMTEVHINTTQRDFLASGSFGRITTEDVPSYGKILKFEGDILKVCARIHRCNTRWLESCSTLSLGRMTVGDSETSGSHFSVGVYLTGLVQRWKLKDIHLQMYNNLTGMYQKPNRLMGVTGHFRMEATAARHVMGDAGEQLAISKHSTPASGNVKDVTEAAVANWQSASNTRVPTIIAVATFAAIPGITTGYQARGNLAPWSSLIRVMASQLFGKSRGIYQVSDALLEDAILEQIDFHSLRSEYVLCDGSAAVYGGQYSWTSCPLGFLFDGLPDRIKLEMCPSYSHDGRSVVVNGLVMPATLVLLQSFQPQQWKASILEGHSPDSAKASIRPENVLWLQVVILDIAIRLLFKGHHEKLNDIEILTLGWGADEITILRCISSSLPVHASEEPQHECAELSVFQAMRPEEPSDDPSMIPLPASPDSGSAPDAPAQSPPQTDNTPLNKPTSDQPKSPQFHEWDLEEAIWQYSGCKVTGEETGRDFARRLAGLLKLRAVFFLAFLLILPDSTDVADAFSSREELPMV